MADELLEQARDLFEGQIDFEGQRLAELLSNALLIVAGIVAFLVGYVKQDIALTLWVGLAGTALAFVVIVPPWPFFNQHPLQWVAPSQSGGVTVEVDGKKVS